MKSLLLFLALFTFTLSQAQTLEEYKKQQQADFDAYRQQSSEQIKALQAQYDNFVRQRDLEFTDFLIQRWEEYNLFTGIQKTPMPKPVVPPVMPLPVVDSVTSNQKPDTLPSTRTSPNAINSLIPVKAPVLPQSNVNLAVKPIPMRKSEPESFPVSRYSIDFYGITLPVNVDKALQLKAPALINNISIAAFWSKASATNYNHLLDQLNDLRHDLNLNDWAYYVLIKKLTASLYPDAENGAALMSWFLMSQSGFKARIAYHGNQAMVLLASDQIVYGKNYLEFEGCKYYLMDRQTDKMQTYGNDFSGAHKLMDFNLESPLALNGEPETKKLHFSFFDKTFDLTLSYDKTLMSFYDEYPNTQVDVFLNATPSVIFKESVNRELLPLISGLSEQQSASLLLQMVQQAFPYAYDKGQFGREKFFFAEEMLHYPGSDCEDHASLFAFLVRELLALRVIGLQYPEHIATAVHFNHEVPGDACLFNNEKYVVCDPTYVNAPVGKSMPQFQNVTAKLIPAGNVHASKSNVEKIWEKVYAAGGYKTTSQGNIITDKDGNYYLAGFFKNELRFGKTVLKGNAENHTAFTASFDKNGRLLWASQPDKQTKAMASFISLTNDFLYVAGTFENTLAFGEFMLSTTSKPDMFIAKYNLSGQLLWAVDAGLDTIQTPDEAFISLQINTNGKILQLELLPSIPGFNGFGMNPVGNGNIGLLASFAVQPGLSPAPPAFANAEGYDLGNDLKKENDLLIKQGYDKAIAGVFAALNIIRLNSVVIPGKTVREVLDRNNPSFRSTSPAIYASLTRINFLKNEDGIIYITTNDGNPVNFDYMRINHGATIKIGQYSNGSAMIEVLSGVSVGKAIVWYNLNNIRLVGPSGDLIFDYARDNSKRKINLKKDVLY